LLPEIQGPQGGYPQHDIENINPTAVNGNGNGGARVETSSQKPNTLMNGLRGLMGFFNKKK
jgi:hypothetical protein